jgi:hypothetical protein
MKRKNEKRKKEKKEKKREHTRSKSIPQRENNTHRKTNNKNTN